MNQPNTYMLPIIHLAGTLAEMLLADAVYFLLATKGETNIKGERLVETTTQELQDLTGLTRKTVRKQLDYLLTLPEPYQFQEESGIVAHGRLLKQSDYNQLNTVPRIQKPCALMQHHWAWVLGQPLPEQNRSSRFPYAILNILLRKPNGRLTSFAELQERCQKAGTNKLPGATHMKIALLFLQNLGLIREENGRYLVEKNQFNQDGRHIYEQIAQPSPINHNLPWPENEAPERSKLTLDIAKIGQFDLWRHGKEIFYDLAQIQPETDWQWLKYAAYRHRHRPQTKDRWQNCWQLFQNSLTRQQYRAESDKVKLTFHHQQKHLCPITLPPHQPTQLRWGKLVIWVHDGRFAATGQGRSESVNLRLFSDKNNQCIWQREIRYEDSVVRVDVTAVIKQTVCPTLYLEAESLQPLKQFHLVFRLEAEYIMPISNTHDS